MEKADSSKWGGGRCVSSMKCIPMVKGWEGMKLALYLDWLLLHITFETKSKREISKNCYLPTLLQFDVVFFPVS